MGSQENSQAAAEENEDDAVVDISSDVIEDNQLAVSDDPEAEGDDSATTDVVFHEPSYKIANKMSFSGLVIQLELLYRLKIERPKNAPDKYAKLKQLLPPKLIQKLNKDRPGEPPESIFPIMRLLLPDRDRRDYSMKEAMIAKAYQFAFGWPDKHSGYRKILNYSDPRIVGDEQGVGDFSVVLQNVLKTRIKDKPKGSGITVGQINELLDELSVASRGKQIQGQAAGSSPKKKKRELRPSEVRGAWIAKLVRLELTPLEHKWVVRILLQRMQISLGWSVILRWYHPMGPAFWSAHNSLKAVCNKLCQPGIKTLREVSDKGSGAPLAPYFKTGNLTHVEFGNPFTPMMSEKTGFNIVLSNISAASKTFADSLDNQDLLLTSASASLAAKFPTFAIETKLDGERFLVHFARDGTVKMHSRQGNWYSELYSPVLGPAIRRAVGHHDMDLILDGEVLAWDNCRKETVPFGNNRTVAIMRRRVMKRAGTLEEIDTNLHKDEKEIKSMSANNTFTDNQDDQPYELAGEECWLQYVAFDVLYIDGPGAGDFLKENTSETCHKYIRPGSIVDLEGFERKKLLYKLINTQENEVEVVPTLVVRPNGETASGRDYFNDENPLMESGHRVCDLDSPAGAFSNAIPNIANIDHVQRKGLTDEQLAKARAVAVEHQYQQIVEGMRLEGLVFKTSRSLGYWRKFKPDYFNGAAASDLDVVVIGAYFATGLRLSGRPSSLLCACVDSYDSDYFYPLCKVNAGSMEREVLQKFFSITGFRAPSAGNPDTEYGSWFQLEDKELPDYVTSRSKQKDQDGKGWKFKKEDYPDMWISPRDSCVVTLNAGEIVNSDAFAPGLTLRFPRIVKLRVDGDAKEPEDIESELTLWDVFKKVLEDRSHGATQSEGDSDPKSRTLAMIENTACRFLTETENEALKKMSRTSKRKKLELAVDTVKAPTDLSSSALTGTSFRVLEGSYRLAHDEVAVEEATEEGWLDIAKSIKSHTDVKKFILGHSGKVLITDKPGTGTFIIGGLETDPRVKQRIQTIEKAMWSHSQRKPPGPKGPTKAALQEENMAKEPGVVRWTYILSAVNSFRKENASGHLQLAPSSLDFLARPASNNSDEEEGDDFGDLLSRSSLRRALGLLAKRKEPPSSPTQGKKKHRNWRDLAMEQLEPEDAWAVSVKDHHPFWCFGSSPEKTPSSTTAPFVLYPDLFEDPVSLCDTDWSDAWDAADPERKSSSLAAVLPLVRVMGGQTVPYLGPDVTHILWDHNPTNDPVRCADVMDPPPAAAAFGELVKQLRENGELSADILFVSPAWVRSQLVAKPTN